MLDKKEIEKNIQNYFRVIKEAEFLKGSEPIDVNDWFSQIIEMLKYLKQNYGRIYFIGNGASSSMASHFASDFTKNGGVNSFSCNDGALLTCFSNDFSYETAYMEILKRYMRDGELLFAISSSGQSKNILTAVEYVKKNYSKSNVVAFSGFKKNNPLKVMGDYSLYLNSNEYGDVESGHAYFLHLIIDFFMKF